MTLLEEVREALHEAATTFRRYEELHRAKGTPEGMEKGYANHLMAERMEASLTRLDQARASESEGGWRPIATAPRDRPIILWAQVEDGERGADYTHVLAHWYPGGEPSDMFGEDGGWMVMFTDAAPSEAVNPLAWCEPLPPPPQDQGGGE